MVRYLTARYGLSGGKQGRMLFGKLMLQKANIMALDEPTNYLDMESIESLNTARERAVGWVEQRETQIRSWLNNVKPSIAIIPNSVRLSPVLLPNLRCKSLI